MASARSWCPSWKPTQTPAPSLSRALRTGTSLASLPVTRMPRASMMRATPDMPAPPMARKCTRPRLVGTGHGSPEVEARRRERVVDGGGARGLGHVRFLPSAAWSTRSASLLVGGGFAQRPGGRRHPGHPLAVGREPDQHRVDPRRGEVGVVDEQAATGGDDVGGVDALLAVADG